MLSDVFGQDEGVRFLQRVVDRQYVSPLLLVGPDGTGKRFSVVQTAKELFCTGTKAPGCDCYDCAQIDEGTHPDFLTVLPKDGKEMQVGQIRSVIEATSAFPSIATLKLFLLDGVDLMNVASANAFLKTLEEPPSVVRFFLLAQRDSRVIPTIRSRCGLVRFRALPEAVVVSKVSEHEADPAKALVYARMGEGSIGRAIGYCGSAKLALRDKVCALLEAGVRRDLPSAFSLISSIEKELPTGLRFLDQIIHDVLMTRHSPDRIIHVDLIDTLRRIGDKVSVEALHKLSLGARSLGNLSVSSRLNLPFHVQTLFVETFFGA